MKTSNILVASIATSAIVMLTIGSTFAAYGQGGGNGMGYGSKGGSNHGSMYNIENIAKSDLNTTETDLLLKQYEEEMMANELYTSFYNKYGVVTFQNIAQSEKTHMDAVKALLDRYELTVPTSYSHIQTLYDQLKAKGDLSLKDALEVGINIEIVDINDIVTAIKSTDNDDIKMVLTNIGGASYNHLRGFVQALNVNNLTTDIDYSAYLTADDLNTRGPLSYKLVDKLEAEGVVLPDSVKQMGNKGANNNGKVGNFRGNGAGMMYNRSNNSGLITQYKNTYKNKYGSALAQMDDAKLNEFVTRIDALIADINSNDKYSTVLKEKYTSMLLALRDLALENVDEGSFIDNLFN
ncbi:MAG: DUF2202 domain-containing protein [Candidatus Gracilibacteria bacterium]|nr:DUF2202 domain-containing protein [Candidatus Gracilibacteria bacterium]